MAAALTHLGLRNFKPGCVIDDTSMYGRLTHDTFYHIGKSACEACVPTREKVLRLCEPSPASINTGS